MQILSAPHAGAVFIANYLVVAGGGAGGSDVGNNGSGGGGGGGYQNGGSPFAISLQGGAGGSGVVIINAGVVATSTTGSPTLSGTIYTFTGSGSITF